MSKKSPAHPLRAAGPPAPASRLGHRPELDGLRAVAVLMVMFGHFGLPGWKGWYLGVDVFFVLSGFLITTLLIEEWEGAGRIRLGHFFARRALRLLPAVMLVLAVTAPFVPRLWTIAAFAYVSNWFLAAGRLGLSPISHLWSLSVEEQFYLLWPGLLVLLLRFRAPRAAILALVAALAAGSAALKMLWWHEPASWVRLYHGSDTHADGLLAGCAIGLLFAWRLLPGTPGFQRALRVAALSALAGFVALCLTQGVESRFLYAQGGLSLAALALAILVLQVVEAPLRPVNAVLGWGPMAAVGRISYGLYLWHHVIAWLPVPAALGAVPPALLMLARFALSFAVAGASYVALERPVLRLKSRFAARTSPGPRAGAARGGPGR